MKFHIRGGKTISKEVWLEQDNSGNIDLCVEGEGSILALMEHGNIVLMDIRSLINQFKMDGTTIKVSGFQRIPEEKEELTEHDENPEPEEAVA